ncbi:hypothetical protein [Clostridium brassicae]|uniref:DUF3311 domain-containing protein n=1 Tax=Clostridium brassicae TaxID=2999072 RepID=A0ABT4D9R0_9CLOT|nr:hypothetical protein [Clostridium brassicae]MCY6959022.1 hypothetical protein [Clostridium brassicae]
MTKKEYFLCIIPILPLIILCALGNVNLFFAGFSLVWLVLTSVLLAIYLINSSNKNKTK